jgi:hypothetical protein
LLLSSVKPLRACPAIYALFNMSHAFGDDELFYGSFPVHITHVPGSVTVYRPSEWTVSHGEEAVDTARARVNPLLMADTRVVVPAIPAVDIVRMEDVGESSPSAADLCSDWPVFMQTPLLKCREGEEASSSPPGSVKAVASGVRSALVKVESKWYRLKVRGWHTLSIVNLFYRH